MSRIGKLLLFMAVAPVACKQPGPARFWLEYQSPLVTSRSSDHGPRGGQSSISWHSEKPHTFTPAAFIPFAAQHGWKIIDSVLPSQKAADGKFFRGDDYAMALFREYALPVLLPGRYTIYIFKTGWISIEPGNSAETYANGFVLCDSSGTTMTMVHSWGE